MLYPRSQRSKGCGWNAAKSSQTLASLPATPSHYSLCPLALSLPPWLGLTASEPYTPGFPWCSLPLVLPPSFSDLSPSQISACPPPPAPPLSLHSASIIWHLWFGCWGIGCCTPTLLPMHRGRNWRQEPDLCHFRSVFWIFRVQKPQDVTSNVIWEVREREESQAWWPLGGFGWGVIINQPQEHERSPRLWRRDQRRVVSGPWRYSMESPERGMLEGEVQKALK